MMVGKKPPSAVASASDQDSAREASPAPRRPSQEERDSYVAPSSSRYKGMETISYWPKDRLNRKSVGRVMHDDGGPIVIVRDATGRPYRVPREQTHPGDYRLRKETRLWLSRGELKGLIREMCLALEEGPTRHLVPTGLQLRHAATGQGGPQMTMDDDRPLVESGSCDECGMPMAECGCLQERKGRRKKNPWAICTSSVGRSDEDKYERCVMHVKGKG